jgi:class 3 adenylate cyclase
MKIQAKLNRKPKILAYREDVRLTNRMKGYKVKMGYGLHIGWGIEGAIGSEFKIDASYLSPNVNMASRLEGTTKAYGVPLLISSDLHELFS